MERTDFATVRSAGGQTARRDAVLVASFGTSYRESRYVTIGAVESAVREAFPDCDVYRAFTSPKIRRVLRERDGIAVDGLADALERIARTGAHRVFVLPTHLMDGREFTALSNTVEGFRPRFDTLRVASPLLADEDDFACVADALEGAFAPFDDGRTALCLVGHGTRVEANEVYAAFERFARRMGRAQWFVSTVGFSPTFADVSCAVAAAAFERAVLRPLMLVAGDHARNDMAGRDDPESLAGMLAAAGVEPICVLEGLGQLSEVADRYVEHLRAIR